MAETVPTVGAIRWDAWYAGNPFQKNLSPKQWRNRLPFYASLAADGTVSVSADSQEVMEREIALARESGLDYWAFVYYENNGNDGVDRFNYGLRRFLAAPARRGLEFCLILQPQHLGPKRQWRQTVQHLVELFGHPAYQKVLEGRPLVYMFYADGLASWAGTDQDAKAALEELDEAALKAGLPAPYLVGQAASAKSNLWLANRFGFDAISAYSVAGRGADSECPYSHLAAENRRFWDDCKSTGKKFIPVVNVGWDNRPRRTSPSEREKLRGPWYLPPTPDELTRHLFSAIQWVKDNTENAEAQSVLVYAWNESDEGGWLVPTISEGNARLDAVKAALHRR